MKDIPGENAIIVKIQTDLKKRYKKKCVDNEITMRDEITKHIEEYVK